VQQPRVAPDVHTGGGGGVLNDAEIAMWPVATLSDNVQEVLVPHGLAAPVHPEN